MFRPRTGLSLELNRLTRDCFVHRSHTTTHHYISHLSSCTYPLPSDSKFTDSSVLLQKLYSLWKSIAITAAGNHNRLGANDDEGLIGKGFMGRMLNGNECVCR